MVVNTTGRFLVFRSGNLSDQRVEDHHAGLIVAAKFSATESKGNTTLVTGECKPGDRIKIIENNGRLEAKPLVLVAFKAADPPAAKVVEYLKRAYKADRVASELCFRRPAFAPELLVVGYATRSGRCSLVTLFAQDPTGALMMVRQGGYGWPEPFIEARVARGGADAERITTLWTREVEWSFTPLETATGDFKSKFAPRFFAPRTSTHGDEVWVEAWHLVYKGCYEQDRRIHDAAKGKFSDNTVVSFCVEDGDVVVRHPDGRKLRNGKPIEQ